MATEVKGKGRRLLFGRVTNFRDLGGYPTCMGGETRWGQVFRSDSLHKLASSDVAAFDAVGLSVIYDLRRQDERTTDPGHPACVHLELPSRRVGDTDPSALRDRTDGERWLFEDYAGMLAAGGPVFGRLFSEVASGFGPAVFHCTGGKDRTGLTAALLLTCLGVSRETVLDDYELTSQYRGAEHLPAVVDFFVAKGIERSAAEGLLSTPRWAMADALRVLDTTFGGIGAYLVDQGNMAEAAIASLLGRLVD